MSYGQNLARQPELKRHIETLLREEYAPVYQNEGFKIYERREAVGRRPPLGRDA